MSKEGSLKATITLSNTGNLGGYETVQLYIQDLVGSITRPVKELKGFQKVWLNAGEKREIEFILNASDLAFYKSWEEKIVEPGKFKLWIGSDSSTGMMTQFEII